MDVCLSHYLPPELVDKIAKEVHRLNMKDIIRQIKFNITWIRVEGKNTFIIHNTPNFYSLLDVEDPDDFIYIVKSVYPHHKTRIE